MKIKKTISVFRMLRNALISDIDDFQAAKNSIGGIV